MKAILRADQVHAVEPAAVMIAAATELGAARDDDTGPTGRGGNVIADAVLTDSGVRVGTVTDVVIDTGTGTSAAIPPGSPTPSIGIAPSSEASS